MYTSIARPRSRSRRRSISPRPSGPQRPYDDGRSKGRPITTGPPGPYHSSGRPIARDFPPDNYRRDNNEMSLDYEIRRRPPMDSRLYPDQGDRGYDYRRPIEGYNSYSRDSRDSRYPRNNEVNNGGESAKHLDQLVTRENGIESWVSQWRTKAEKRKTIEGDVYFTELFSNDVDEILNELFGKGIAESVETPYGVFELSGAPNEAEFDMLEETGTEDITNPLVILDPEHMINAHPNVIVVAPLATNVKSPSAWGAVKRSVSDALTFAADTKTQHPTILLLAGTYYESINLTTPTRIAGVEPDVWLRSDKTQVIKITVDDVILDNLNIRNDGDSLDTSASGVRISGGTKITGCSISTLRGNAISMWAPIKSAGSDVNSTTTVKISDSLIHNATACGAFLAHGCRLIMRNCRIETCGTAGIEGREGSETRLERCVISHCAKSGIFLHGKSTLKVLGCDIFSCGMAGLELARNANAVLLYSRVFRGIKGGVFVHDSASVVIRRCQIFSNSMSNVDIRSQGSADCKGNRIYDSAASGVYVSAQGRCVLNQNLIHSNKCNGVELNGGITEATANRIFSNRRCALYANGDCSGTFSHNDLRYNREKSISKHLHGSLPAAMEENQIDDGGKSPTDAPNEANPPMQS